MIILMAFYFPELQTKTKSFWFFSFHWHLYNKSPIRIRYKKKRSIQLYVEPKRGLTSNGFYWIRKKLSAFQFTRVIRSTSSQRPVDSGEFDWNKLKKKTTTILRWDWYFENMQNFEWSFFLLVFVNFISHVKIKFGTKDKGIHWPSRTWT